MSTVYILLRGRHKGRHYWSLTPRAYTGEIDFEIQAMHDSPYGKFCGCYFYLAKFCV